MAARKSKRGVTSGYPSIIELFDDGGAIDDALRQGVQDALRRHKRLGQRVATWENGRVVVLEPEEIPVDISGAKGGRRSRKAGSVPRSPVLTRRGRQ